MHRTRRRRILPDLHGHWDTVPVVKLQMNGPLIGVPELFCAPDTVAV